MRYGIVSILCGVVVTACTVAAASENEELYARLRYASGMKMESGVFECQVSQVRRARTITAEQLMQATKDYERELRDKFGKGDIPPDWQARLRQRYGDADFATLSSTPEVREMLERKVQEMVRSYSLAIADSSKDREEVRTTTYTLAGDGRIRLDKTYQRKSVGGEEVLNYRGRHDTMVLAPAYVKELSDLKGVMTGCIYAGLSESKQFAMWDYGERSPAEAGSPGIAPFKAEDILSSGAVETPEGQAIRLVFGNQMIAPGVGNVRVLWVLPEKGYRTYRCENYMHGCLTKVEEYADYTEAEPGLWIPRAATVTVVQAELPDELLRKLKDGTLRLTSDEVLKNQIVRESTQTKRTIVKYELSPALPEALFDIRFPAGTRMYDYTKKEGGQALSYIAGGLLEGHDPSKTTAIMDAFAPGSPATLPAASATAGPARVPPAAAITESAASQRAYLIWVGVALLLAVAASGLWYCHKRKAVQR